MRVMVIMPLVTLFGCTLNTPKTRLDLPKFDWSGKRLPILTTSDCLTAEQKEKLKKWLAYLPVKTLETITAIDVRNDKNHFGENTLAHTKLLPGGYSKICLHTDSFKETRLGPDWRPSFVLFHEAGHAHTNKYRYLFSLWRISYNNYPDDEQLNEDIANWTAYAYCYLIGFKTTLHTMKELNQPKKIDFLYYGELLDYADYLKIKPLLE